MNSNKERTILTVFSGRKDRMRVLLKYMKRALELKLIDEVHLWNYTRNDLDDEFLKSISNLKRSSSTNDGRYIEIYTPIIDNSFKINVMARNDIHIKIADKSGLFYEIVLGGWGNTMSVVRKNSDLYNIYQLHHQHNSIAEPNNKINIKITVIDSTLFVYKNDNLIICCQVQNGFKIHKTFFKTGFGSVGYIDYPVIQNHGFFYMDTCMKKRWDNYYNHYTSEEYTNDIIIKSDDDIVFIDLNKFQDFINFRKKSDADLIFANTINNGVSAYFQQHKLELIPKNILQLEYPYGETKGDKGTLWESGQNAEIIHNYFINNYESFINNVTDFEYEIIDSRFSINFFAFKGNQWYKISDCENDNFGDEWNLTITYVNNEKKFKNLLYYNFYVSHLSFFQQENTGINCPNIIEKYDQLSQKLL
jgi:hypothetical protein